jgi:hypothetical protein
MFDWFWHLADPSSEWSRQEIAGIAAGIVSFGLGHVWYMVTIVRGGTKPHFFTWFLSAIMAALTLVTYKASGAEETILVPLGDFIAFLIIAGLAWKYRQEEEFSREDWWCLGVALTAILLYLILENPLLSFTFILLAEVVTLIPTAMKTWEKPQDEDWIAWAGTCIGNLINFFAINQILEVEWVYVSVVFVADLIIWLLILTQFIRQRRENNDDIGG